MAEDRLHCCTVLQGSKHWAFLHTSYSELVKKKGKKKARALKERWVGVGGGGVGGGGGELGW